MDPQNVDNQIEIRTMTDEEIVASWASKHKISADAVDKLFEEGFTSMEAVSLINAEDLSKIKIPRGQKKLIIASVENLQRAQEFTLGDAHARQESIPISSERQESHAPLASAQPTAQPESTAQASAYQTSELPGKDGGACQIESGRADDAYIRALIQQFQQGQTQTRQSLNADSLQRNVLGGQECLNTEQCGTS